MGPEQLERNLSILFPGAVEEGGKLGRKGVKRQWLLMSLAISILGTHSSARQTSSSSGGGCGPSRR